MEPFLPYFAGFFDGEGSIGIYRNGAARGRTLRVQLTQNISVSSTLLLLECQSRWGGSLCEMNREKKRPAWNWQVSAGSGAIALRQIRPWLRLKAREADIALEWWDARPPQLRGPDGRLLPFSEAQRALDAAAEQRLKSARDDRVPSRVTRLRSDGQDIIALHRSWHAPLDGRAL